MADTGPQSMVPPTLVGTLTASSTPTSTIMPYTSALTGVDVERDTFQNHVLWWSLGIVALVVLLVRIIELVHAHVRHLTTMTATKTQQAYWSRNQSTLWPKIKKDLLYAPLFKKRHNREIRLSSAVNMGTLPSRFHAILLGSYLLSNIAYCSFLDYSLPNRYEILAQLRGRSGVLSIANMIALVLLAGRNNPLINLLKVSFDTYNLLHRWMGRMVIIEAIVHTLAWLFTQLAAAGWESVKEKILDDHFITWGTVGTGAMILLLFTSPSALRHAFYETFLNVHIILAAAAIAGVWIHCDLGNLPQFIYIKAIVGLWAGDRLARFTRILWYNYSRKGWTNATIECLPGDAVRVTLHVPTHFSVEPGSHAYLRFGSIRAWESHPFSIAWVDHTPKSITSKPDLPSTEKIVSIDSARFTTDISFVIQAQSGLTRTLHNRALALTPRPLCMRAAFEGPYGGHHSLASYGHCVMFCGSSGITHQLPYLRQLLEGSAAGTVATRKITLIWIVRDLEHLEWVRPWMDQLLQLPGRREILNIKLFITRPKSPREVISPSRTVQMFPGRPDVNFLLTSEANEQVGAMAVTVCGPGGLADNVREAVRGIQHWGNIDFIEESFTW